MSEITTKNGTAQEHFIEIENEAEINEHVLKELCELDPNKERPEEFKESEDFQRVMLAAFLTVPELMEQAPFARPSWFVDARHKLLFEIARDYHDKYKLLPSKPELASEINTRLAEKSDVDRLFCRTELAEVLEYYRDGVHPVPILDRVRRHGEYVCRAQWQIKQVEAWRKGCPPHVLDDLDRRKEAELATIRGTGGNDLLGWDDYMTRAEQQPTVWIIDNLVGVGEISMPHALPWGGKSTLLAKAITDVCQGQDFFGYKTTPAPVLYINADRASYDLMAGRLKVHVFDPDSMRKRFFAPATETLPKICTTQYLEGIVKRVQDRTGEKHVWLIVDTLRPAFLSGAEKGAENDSATLTSILTPVRDLADRTKSAVTVVHHNSKSTDDFAGTTEIAGKVDSFINITREMDSTTATVTIATRRGHRNKFHVSRTEDGKLILADGLPAAKTDMDLTEFMALFSTDAADAMDLEAIMALAWVQAKAWSVSTVRKKLQEAQKPGSHPRLENVADNGQKGRYVRV